MNDIFKEILVSLLLFFLKKGYDYVYNMYKPIHQIQLAVIEQNNIALSKQITKERQNRQIIMSLVYLLIAVLAVWFMYNQYKKLQVS